MKFNPLELISKAFSIILHPLLIPTLLFSLTATYAPNNLIPISGENTFYLVLFILATTYIIPLLFIYGFYLTGFLSSIYLDTIKDRIIAISITSILYVLTIYTLYSQLRANEQILLILSGITVCMILGGIITIFWKISLHVTAISGLLCYVFFLALKNDDNALLWPIILSILLAGCLMSSRLYLNKHSLKQILGGLLLGTMVTGIFALIIYRDRF